MTDEDAIAAILAREQEKGVVTEAELRQQLADVTNERDELRKQREAILMQARVWAGEAKTQRSTVESVGAILGGIPDWGPIAAGVEALKDRLNASEARNAEAMELLGAGAYYGPFQWNKRVLEWLAQSAPATNHSSTSDLPDGPLTDEGTKQPATDEQGAGS